MDESAMSYYSQQLNITPEILDDAWKYLYQILKVFKQATNPVSEFKEVD